MTRSAIQIPGRGVHRARPAVMGNLQHTAVCVTGVSHRGLPG